MQCQKCAELEAELRLAEEVLLGHKARYASLYEAYMALRKEMISMHKGGDDD